MVRFSKKELSFIKKHEVCRMATVAKGKPHVVPICYMFIDSHFYLATDYETKKYRNLKRNKNVAIVIDEYQPNKAVLIEGKTEMIEKGKEFRDVYDKFHKKFSWVRDYPWEEGEAPFIKIEPLKKISWGL